MNLLKKIVNAKIAKKEEEIFLRHSPNRKNKIFFFHIQAHKMILVILERLFCSVDFELLIIMLIKLS